MNFFTYSLIDNLSLTLALQFGQVCLVFIHLQTHFICPNSFLQHIHLTVSIFESSISSKHIKQVSSTFDLSTTSKPKNVIA